MFNDDVSTPSNCGEVRQSLGRWYDAECDAATASRVEQHLSHCSRCANALERWRRVDEMLESELTPPDSIQSLSEAVRRRIVQRWWARAAAAAMIGLALGALGGSYVPGRRAEPRPEHGVAGKWLEESFAPGSYRGFDDLARDLEPATEGGR